VKNPTSKLAHTGQITAMFQNEAPIKLGRKIVKKFKIIAEI
jgi:hypothetical protein